MYRQFNIQQFYVLPKQSIYMFCVDLRTNSDYSPIQHKLTGFYYRDGACLLRGMEWIFNNNSCSCQTLIFEKAAPCLGLSPPRNVFDPWAVSVRFVVDKVTLRRCFVSVIRIFSGITIPAMLHTYLHVHAGLTRRTKERSL